MVENKFSYAGISRKHAINIVTTGWFVLISKKGRRCLRVEEQKEFEIFCTNRTRRHLSGLTAVVLSATTY